MGKRILVLGGTGILGLPVVKNLSKAGHQVRVLARNVKKARTLLGEEIEIVEGNVLNRNELNLAMMGCYGVHVSLPPEYELAAMRKVIDYGEKAGLKRISYISATTAAEENRWFNLIDIKLRAEELLHASKIQGVVFCPTWAMETLYNFIHGNRAIALIGKNPPDLHFFAGEDLGRIVAASYMDDRAVGKRLFVHGPEGIKLPDAIERFVGLCFREQKIMRVKLWQAKLIAKLFRKKDLEDVVNLIDYFDKVGELGDPTEANLLFGTPAITLEEWCRQQKLSQSTMPSKIR